MNVILFSLYCLLSYLSFVMLSLLLCECHLVFPLLFSLYCLLSYLSLVMLSLSSYVNVILFSLYCLLSYLSLVMLSLLLCECHLVFLLLSFVTLNTCYVKFLLCECHLVFPLLYFVILITCYVKFSPMWMSSCLTSLVFCHTYHLLC